MLQKNEHYQLNIMDLSSEGFGIGKVHNITVFVDKTLPGDYCEVRIVKIKKNYCYGKLINILSPSQDRVEPLCDSFGKCGGCTLLHYAYPAQLSLKTKIVQDCLERIGGFKGMHVDPIIGMEEPYYYRNKAQFPVKRIDGEVYIGFFEPRSHRIVDVKECRIQHKINQQIIDLVRSFINDHNISVYDEETGKGLIRHIITRIGFSTGEIMVCLVINGSHLPSSEFLIENLTKIKNMSSIVLNIHKNQVNSIKGKEIKTIWGKPEITDYLDDIKLTISPLAFYQVNPVQTKVLYNKALEFLNLSGKETVLDAYCGIGTISLFISRKARKVIGVEIVPEAIENAIHNCKINQIDNCEFIQGKSEEIIPKLYQEGTVVDAIVVNPPRKGCEPSLIETIIQMKPEKIVYISCNPATLARDLSLLSENNLYQLNRVQPVDQFPNTMHVETVVLMSRVCE